MWWAWWGKLVGGHLFTCSPPHSQLLAARSSREGPLLAWAKALRQEGGAALQEPGKANRRQRERLLVGLRQEASRWARGPADKTSAFCPNWEAAKSFQQESDVVNLNNNNNF